MDLSKIPEPSADEIEEVDMRLWMKTTGSTPDDRVIAHLLRHGRVLSSNIDIEMVDSEQLGKVMVAIEVFEKFGGGDE